MAAAVGIGRLKGSVDVSGSPATRRRKPIHGSGLVLDLSSGSVAHPMGCGSRVNRLRQWRRRRLRSWTSGGGSIRQCDGEANVKAPTVRVGEIRLRVLKSG
ncbi:hypothetical protein OROHE_006515 [Orobanche hederae]